MSPDPPHPADLPAAALEFLTERHLGTFSSVRPDGTVHVTAVGFTWDPDRRMARVITSSTSRKARYADGRPVALCQVDGARWLTLEGTARVTGDPDVVAEAVDRYRRRYREPRVNPRRVAIEVAVTRVLGSARLLT